MYRYIIISGLLLSLLYGQEVPDKENQYLQLQTSKQIAERQLDSLNQSLDDILKKIDEEKSKNKDENKTTYLMSSALSITKKIESKEDLIGTLNNRIIQLEKELNTMYAKQMADLEKQLQGSLKQDEKEKMEQDLNLLAEKRISVVPLFYTFRFNPAKINIIDVTSITDDLEKEISLDYLKSALAQVDSNITIISEKTQELEDNKRLEEKAAKFMDDVAESRVLGFYESSAYSASAEIETDVYGRNRYPVDKGEWTYVQENAIANAMDFLSQLEYMGMPVNDHIYQFKISASELITPEEYLEILKSSNAFLKKYRKMLLKKIAGE
ncbi:MAG: hypothetical protein JW956_13785 [Calditrichaceae bacterium]|nr:hypothetical protein [Calditrichaceae bacterium]